ncbi:MAG: hypothetical protein C4531_15545 [Desulfurivibrio sp.]|jgi:hypothetical protein|nr:MAG: hypothetical protein C4531_15545 [Desulfurivibrio sp.]
MEYRKTLPFDGDRQRAVDLARSVFINNNFKIESADQAEVLVRGPGMQGTRQNPLVGASRVRLRVEAASIELSAELGGVRRIRNFLLLFPPALASLLSLVFLILPMQPFAAAIPWLAVSPWLFLSPLMARWIRSRTIAALDTLLHNMKLTGEMG